MFVKILPLLLVFGLFVAKPTSTADFDYIGAAKCKMCHNKPPKGEQYNKWKAGPHANAMKKLTGDDAKDPKCLKCHSTAGAIDAKYNAGVKASEGVSCESCHGPGSAYKSMSVMKSREKSMAKGLIIPDEKLCKTCHNEESPDFKGFDYAEYSKKIAHPDPSK